MAVTTDENEALRHRTGEVNDDDPLVNFLYLLMRDHLSTGVVEGIVQPDLQRGGLSQYTNGHLARYAQDLAARLTMREPIRWLSEPGP